jgi:hypothetical protein
MDPGGNAAGWLVLAMLCLVPALVRLSSATPLMILVAIQALAEAPLQYTQSSMVPPDPIEAELLSLPPGKFVVFPSPAAPWHQGQRSPAELMFRATLHAHPIPIELDPAAAPLLLHLSQVADLPVDISVAELAWSLRAADPIQTASNAGYTGVLIDRRALDDQQMQRVDGWLAARVGLAMATSQDWAVHGLRPL